NLKDPTEAAAAWRLAMACYFVGFRLTPERDAKAELYSEGRAAAFIAAREHDKCAACHFWGAIDLALLGQAVGALKMLFALGELRDHLKLVNELDPRYAFGGAHRMLGMIEWKLPGILGGSNDRAREHFEKALAIAPDEPLNYLFLARMQAEDLDDHEGAASTARRGLDVPTPPDERLESLEALMDLKQLLEKESQKR
ncbi:MAG: hypothetical protein HY075_01495, partial [Deltaproteobacteria bacterium]|nr:hypothetical protein [Deltaproteobacteria bacterium]